MSRTETPHRRASRWRLRRLDVDTARSVVVSAFPAAEAQFADARIHASTPTGLITAPELDARNRGTECVVEVEPAERWRCGVVLVSGGSVALDDFQLLRSVERRLVEINPVERPPASAPRVAQPRKQELSLAERLALALQPPLDLLLEMRGPLDWPDELRPYQREGAVALIERDALLLADDMGLGKTIQAIAALRLMIRLRRVHQALVVAPASLITQWKRELGRWAPEIRTTVVRGSRVDRRRLWQLRSHVYVVGYETLRNDVSDYEMIGPDANDWDVVVLDEAQKIKNQATQVARVCRGLKRRASWALTGTPLENDLNELLSIIDFLTPLGGGYFEVSDIRKRQRNLQLRRRKTDVLNDLPAKSVHDLWLQLDHRQRKTYERAERDGVVDLERLGQRITVTHVFALIQRLKQICNVCPETGASAKLDDLRGRLHEIAAEGQRALVFSQYVDADFGVVSIARHLDGLNPLTYHGGLSAREKDDVISRFTGSDAHKVLVLSLRAGGQGLNLQAASYVVHFDRWWNPAVERQAEDRTHRIGQRNAVTVYRYICEGTIEERIARILQEKQSLFDLYVDQVSIDPGRLLGEKEIFGLFGLEPPARGSGATMEELPS